MNQNWHPLSCKFTYSSLRLFACLVCLLPLHLSVSLFIYPFLCKYNRHVNIYFSFVCCSICSLGHLHGYASDTAPFNSPFRLFSLTLAIIP